MAAQKFFVDIDLQNNRLLNVAVQASATAPTSPVAGQFYYNTTVGSFFGFNGTTWVDMNPVIEGQVKIKGEIANANTNPAYPASPEVGDTYIVTTNAGTIGGQEVEVGDQLIYSNSGWVILQANIINASQTIAGKIRLATQAETNAGSLNNVAISPSTLAIFLSALSYARKVTHNIVNLPANTPTTVTHGLNLAANEELIVQTYQGGEQVFLNIKTVSPNSITVESNTTLGNVKVICIG